MNHTELGAIIKSLRKKRGLTGAALAEKTGVSQSKLSKIETGVHANVEPDLVKRIMNILNAPQSILQQSLQSLDDKRRPPFMQISSTFDCNCINKEISSRSIRIFTTSIMPALLHTTSYHSALRTINGDNAVAQGIKELHARQDLLWQGKRNYTFIMMEAALYNSVGSKLTQLAQLDRLRQSIDIPRVKIGIIPTTASLPTIDLCSFVIYDARLVTDAVQHRELTSNNPDDIQIHAAAFSSLEHIASYNDDACDLIRKAMDIIR